MKKSINIIIEELTAKLLPVCGDEISAQSESWWLLEAITNKSKSQLVIENNITLTYEQEERLSHFVNERTVHKKPLQYILGSVPFCDLEILVEPPILIPRPETEEWCAWLIEQLTPLSGKKFTILDIGCGSGCIALALARAFPYASVIGVDIHDKAIQLSEKNKAHNAITNAIFIKSNLYSELTQYKNSFDLIVSNPPYIAPEEYKQLDPQVKEWEDKTALMADDEGFAIHKKIVFDAKKYLNQGGSLELRKLPQLVIEFGKGQEEKLKKILFQADFTNVEIHEDLEGVPRWITGRSS